MIAKKRKVLLSLQTSTGYSLGYFGTVALHAVLVCMIHPCSTYAVTVPVLRAQLLACLYGSI